MNWSKSLPQLKILNLTNIRYQIIRGRIEKLESEGDRLYRKEVAHLFESCVNPIEVIKWKEVLEYLENTLDHCEDISDLIRGVVMKYA